MKKLIATLVLTAVLLAGCGVADPATKEGAQKIAEKWVKKNAQTYMFDGSDLKRTKIFPLSCENCFKYEFTFESSHAGYGDRSGQELEEVATEHTIGIYVENGEITGVTTDGEYDELNPPVE